MRKSNRKIPWIPHRAVARGHQNITRCWVWAGALRFSDRDLVLINLSATWTPTLTSKVMDSLVGLVV